MNGFAPASRLRVLWTLPSLLVCLILLAGAFPLRAASQAKSAAWTSSVPAGLRNAIDRTLGNDQWTETQAVTEADPAFDPEFGVAVALHGTTAMIGAQQAKIGDNDAQGAVYVFQESNGVWTRTQKLVASDGQAFDTFGHAIVFDGTTALIGAYGVMVNDNFSQGAVYVFSLSNGTWTQTQKITANDGQAFNNFGYSLGLSGTTALIGADGATVGTNDFQGKVYAFTEADGIWTQGQTLVADDGGIGDIFGYSIAFDGTRAVIGAYANNGYQGAAYVFGVTDGTWSQSQKLVAAAGASNTYFGYATALSGSTVLVGAWGANPGGVDTQGAAYIFTESNGTWTQTQELLADDGGAGDKFGHSVALDGTTALIGADGNGNAQGAVYAFDATGGMFAQSQKFLASNGAPSDQFGLPITLDGSAALVGSWLWLSPDNRMPGSAYFFTRGPSSPVDEIFQDGFESSGGSGNSATLAQTIDTTPVTQNSAACSHTSDGTTTENQYWRRYDFSDYAVTSAANVTSVDVSVQQTMGAPNVTVTLYTTPHSVTVDTIDVGQLTQIGQASVASPANAALTSINVPVTGTIADTVGTDLVVEVSTDDGSVDGTVFYIGSTPSAETHPSFISSASCGISAPTATANIGYPNMHIIQAVNIDD
jgi:hypothetical protein